MLKAILRLDILRTCTYSNSPVGNFKRIGILRNVNGLQYIVFLSAQVVKDFRQNYVLEIRSTFYSNGKRDLDGIQKIKR